MFTGSILKNWFVLMALGFPSIIAYIIAKEFVMENSLIPIGVGVLVAVVWGLLFTRIPGLNKKVGG